MEEKEELQEIEDNLQIITDGVPYIYIDDLHRIYQRHTVGVSRQFGRLLCTVDRVIMCYHEQED